MKTHITPQIIIAIRDMSAHPGRAARLMALCLFLVGFNHHATAQSTMSPADHFAWGANTGWHNWRASGADGVVIGEAFLSGYIYAANLGWIHLGDGTPSNGHTYSNTTATDCGVNHDGAGNLSGFAYGANIGWINFGWAGANDPNRPHFDLTSGNFLGYAYSANTGWINIGTGDLYTDTMTAPDLDADGIADAWEFQKFGNLSVAGIGTDRDHDGQSDAAEYAADTDPNSAGDFLRIVSQTYNAGMTQVTLQIATTRPTRLYRIETSTTLLSTGPGAWATDNSIGYFTTGPGGTTTKLVTFTGAARRFFRVAADRPLP
ncbi:MAG: hypothetical protein K1X78_10435 [Verrucomicrobiaceae bacterium]|nr:hypothetical protein [Verrucomicrobiaceae bacterium]